MPKIICISDTHSTTPEVPSGDILIHAGDLTNRGNEAELRDQLAWLDSLPHKHKIFIAGNHDFIFEIASDYAKYILKDYKSLTYLQDESINIEGIKFYGSPWQPEFNNWAFNLKRGDELKKKWELIPQDTDFLITHCPPKGILDFVKPLNTGCEELLEVVSKIKPRYHVFGHVHEGAGKLEQDGITFINASVLDDKYKPYTTPIHVIEI